MIYTVTFNPSLDYIVSVGHFRLGELNRTKNELLFPGGKGINVSIVLKNLGIDNVALGFTAGFTGREIERLLQEKGVRSNFVRLKGGFSRINVKLRSNPAPDGYRPAQGNTQESNEPVSKEATPIKSASSNYEATPIKSASSNYEAMPIKNTSSIKHTVSAINPLLDDSDASAGPENKAVETEINGRGPDIGAEAIQALYGQLDQMLPGDILVLSGSIPAHMPDTMYMDIMKRLQGKGIRIAVDATGYLLCRTLEYRPFLVKPNNHELGEIFGAEIRTKDDAAKYGKKLRERGAENVLVSMAGEGAVLIDSNGEEHRAQAPKGLVRNSIGAGDSMLAGFLAGLLSFPPSENGKGESRPAVPLSDCGNTGPHLLSSFSDYGKSESQSAPSLSDWGKTESFPMPPLSDYGKEKSCPIPPLPEYSSESYKQALLMAVCTGSASAFSEKLATKEEVEALLRQIQFQ